NVMEAADIGAIFSLFVAAFVLFKAIADEGGAAWAKVGRGVGRVAIIALFAGFIATQTIVALVGAAIVGITGTAQDVETKAQHWDGATQWSLPKLETLSLFMPGVFGYKMDTPNNMPDFLQDAYQGGEYWGGMGRDPVLDRFFDSGGQGQLPPYSYMRQTGGQNYAGILVVLLAFWTMAQSLRRENSAFPEAHRRFIWFWSVVLIGSLLLAYGRFAPFYKFFYMLPYVSTIRNPAKFLFVFSWAIVILFAGGVHGLSRRYLEIPAANSPLLARLKNWWAMVRGFDRNWTYACVVALFVTVFGWLVYASEKPGLVRYLQTVGFGEEDTAKRIAAFSIGQVGWFVLWFALAAGLCVLTIAGVFAGRRAWLGGMLLGLLLVGDLGRADLPYIIHWNSTQKYDIDSTNPANSTNPIINFLRDKSYEHRVTYLPFNESQHLPLYDDWFGDLYRIEWAQHHFPYYNIQSLDKIQMPRMPADLLAYEMALTPRSAGTAYLLTRRWELTNTRYLLGLAGLLNALNEQLDPVQHRFRIVQSFDIVPKPGLDRVTRLEEMTAGVSENGGCALFEFTGALPRAKLYSNWRVSTNDTVTLQTLTNAIFDPQQTVLVSTPLTGLPAVVTNENSGTVEFKSYMPNTIVLGAQAAAPSVLLLNDMYDPHWQVYVDGKPVELLRCNYIMRGVFLTPGAHQVEFKFSLPTQSLYITLAAIGVGILLCGFLIFSTRRHSRPAA
ncbi:MAG TPA: YfhO family protein, partial [Candidatus Nitrosopolaris sp.]|nr:YfhO family protein [Candidatus Nitrosopolaris sp.]